MKINKSNTTITFFLFINPLLGFLLSLFSLRKENFKFFIITASFFVFCITLYTPPYQDLYRKYISTYYVYNQNTTLLEALKGQVDFLFYTNSWLLFKLSLPFYLIPAIYSSLSMYLTLSAAKDFWVLNAAECRRNTFLICVLCVFSFVDFIMIASTLRFGFAVSLILKGITSFYIKDRKKTAIILFILSVTCHMSMLLVVVAIFCSSYIKISRLTCGITSVIVYSTSIYIFPFILNSIHLGILNEYITNGYLNTDYANISENINTLLVQSSKWFMLLVFFIFYYKQGTASKEFDNFVRLLIILSCTTALSVTMFNRYFNGLLLPLIVISALSKLLVIEKSKFFKVFIIFIFIFNTFVVNIFLERRQLIMGEMWRGLYTPVFFIIIYNMDDFNSYLKDIDSDGNWVKNRLAN